MYSNKYQNLCGGGAIHKRDFLKSLVSGFNNNIVRRANTSNSWSSSSLFRFYKNIVTNSLTDLANIANSINTAIQANLYKLSNLANHTSIINRSIIHDSSG